MPEFRYAQGRILDSLRYLSEEMKEFQEDYSHGNIRIMPLGEKNERRKIVKKDNYRSQSYAWEASYKRDQVARNPSIG